MQQPPGAHLYHQHAGLLKAAENDTHDVSHCLPRALEVTRMPIRHDCLAVIRQFPALMVDMHHILHNDFNDVPHVATEYCGKILDLCGQFRGILHTDGDCIAEILDHATDKLECLSNRSRCLVIKTVLKEIDDYSDILIRLVHILYASSEANVLSKPLSKAKDEIADVRSE